MAGRRLEEEGGRAESAEKGGGEQRRRVRKSGVGGRVKATCPQQIVQAAIGAAVGTVCGDPVPFELSLWCVGCVGSCQSEKSDGGAVRETLSSRLNDASLSICQRQPVSGSLQNPGRQGAAALCCSLHPLGWDGWQPMGSFRALSPGCQGQEAPLDARCTHVTFQLQRLHSNQTLLDLRLSTFNPDTLSPSFWPFPSGFSLSWPSMLPNTHQDTSKME